MKKNDWILIVSVILYSFLFYNQLAGINFLIFNILLIIGLWKKEKEIVKNRKWQLAACLTVLTSIAISIYGNGLAVFANVIALSILSSCNLKGENSFLVSLAFSFYSYVTSVFYMVIDWQKRSTGENSRSVPSVKRTFLILIPILIALLFLFLYRASNPLFNDFIKKINLDFISFELLFFTLGGFILLYGFYYHRKINLISELDLNSKQTIADEPSGQTFLFGKNLTSVDELFSGKILFVLLNLLILILNFLDFDFLFISHRLPDGITYSQYVHQGTGALIFSIIVSVFIILFYFRGEINFSKQSKLIRILAYVWIVQNVIMLISTSLKNGMYIGEYGLTYKRIGVFIYLLLTAIGLVTTYIKIARYKTASYMIRINSWLFYFVLVISCFINWDLLITNFNIKHSGSLTKPYLLELSNTNLPQLFLMEKVEKKQLLKSYIDSISEGQKLNQIQLSSKLFDFVSMDQNMNWRSWNYDHSRVKSELKEMNRRSEIMSLRLPGKGLYDLQAMKDFWNVAELDLSSNYIESISKVSMFPGLTRLNLSWNRLQKLNGLENLQKLEYLDLRGNPIVDYTMLFSLRNLKEVDLPANFPASQIDLLIQQVPELKIYKY